MQIIDGVRVTFWLIFYLLENFRLCRFNVLTELLLLEHCRLCRCSVVIIILRVVSYRICRFNILNVIFMLASYRLCRCSVWIELLLLENYRLCRCSVVIKKLLANFRLCKCNAMSFVKAHSNADLKICQYLCLNMKIMYLKFFNRTPFTLHARYLKIFLQTLRNNRIC